MPQWDAYQYEEKCRFRCNLFTTRNKQAVVLRLIPNKVPSFDDLGLPKKALAKICSMRRGLVLVTGITGSGKSTTLSAVINHINETHQRHVVTLEDPIEFIHRPKLALVNQRQVHRDTHSFSVALRSALREDPDVILVGELRDLETIRLALTQNPLKLCALFAC